MTFTHLEPPKTVRCTKTLVEEFAGMEPAPYDRPFQRRRAAAIKRAIIKETFRVASFASCYCKETRRTYRVNGKHTALVLKDLNGRFPTGLPAVVERYAADTLADVAECYASFDPRASCRSGSDINLAFAASRPELATLPRPMISAAVRGLAFATWEYDLSRREPDERATLLLEHAGFACWLAALLCAEQQSRHLLRAAPVAAMFRTYARGSKPATEFWTLVAAESHPKNTHPTRVLARWLLTHEVSMSEQRAGQARVDSLRGMYVRCLVAWNAWRAGKRTVELTYHPADKTPPVH